MACSAGGSIFAFIRWDQSSAQFNLRMSNNSGASFGGSIFAGTSASSSDSCSVYVSPDGSVISATMADGTVNIRYGR